MSSLKKGKPSHNKGKSFTEDHKRKIGEANKGKVPNELTKQNRLNTRLANLIQKHEAILQIDKVTHEVIKEWVLLPKDIAKHLNVYDTNIIKCLKNKKEHAVGYIWKYKK